MRRFLTTLSAFLALQALLAAALWSRYPLPRNSMFAAAHDKLAHLQATPAPRLILVGGSNLAFGMDSPRLAQALGRPVLNMGLHAGLRLGFMVRQVEPELRPGDVVLVTPEYEQFVTFPDVLPPFQLMEQDLAQARFFTASDWIRLANTAQLYVAHVTQVSARRVFLHEYRQPTAPYTRDSFNASGDMVAHLDLPTTAPPLPARWGLEWRPAAVARGSDLIAELARVAAAHQARVLFAYPPVPAPLVASRAADLQRLDVQLRAALPDVVFLNQPSDACLPPAVFYDTYYHLLRAGRDQRVSQLLTALQAAHVGPAAGTAPAP